MAAAVLRVTDGALRIETACGIQRSRQPDPNGDTQNDFNSKAPSSQAAMQSVG